MIWSFTKLKLYNSRPFSMKILTEMFPHKLYRCPTISEKKHEKCRFNRRVRASDRVKALEANLPSDDKLEKS